MPALVIAFCLSCLSTFLILRLRSVHLHITSDSIAGVQKFHVGAVPRIGGVAVLIGFLFALIYIDSDDVSRQQRFMLLLAALPCFFSGLAEDLTKRITASLRFWSIILSAIAGAFLLGAQIMRIGVPGVDWLLSVSSVFSMLVTVFAVAGVTNSLNIIDGFNGLASMVSIMMFLAIAYVAWRLGDTYVFQVCLVMVSALLGFFVWNYPRGLIFLGDAGAYFIGFVLAEMAVLLVARNSDISPWFCFLVCGYPITETIFSIYRKRFLRGVSPGLPDSLHLHMLVHRRMIRVSPTMGRECAIYKRNSATSPYLWCLALFAILPAVVLWRNEALLVLCSLMFIMLYIKIYFSLVRFRIPRCLKWYIG